MRRRGLLDMGLPSAGLLGQVIGPRPMPVQQGRAPSVLGAPAMRGGGSFGQGLASLGQSLSGIAEMRQRQEVLDMQKQRLAQEAQQAAMQQQQANSQQQARAILYGGVDPITGINWNTGRPGMDPTQERALMARAYPQAAQAAAIAVLTPREPPKAERFEVKQGDRIKTFVGVPGDPNTWQEVATAPRSEAQPETYKLFSPRGDKEQTVTAGSMTERELKKLGWSMLPAQGSSQSETDRKIERLMRADPSLNYSTAVAIADGRYTTSRDPISGTAQIVDKATGRLVGTTTARATSAPSIETARSTVPGPGEGADYRGAVGARGVFSNLANTITDALGLGIANPATEKATQAFTNLQTQTMLQLADAFPGRPSNLVREELRNFAVEPNSFFQGEARSVERLQQTRRYIDVAIGAQNSIVENASQHTPKQVAEARQKLVNLRDLGSSYDSIINSFGGESGAQQAEPPPSSYTGPSELWQYMTPEERALWQ